MNCKGRRPPPIRQLNVETFRPYLEARDWDSINRGKVITFDNRDGASPNR